MVFLQGLHLRRPWKNSILQRKTVQKPPNRGGVFYAASMSRASWSKLGGGKLRRPELELARELGWDWGRATGFRPQEKGRGVLLDCAWTRKPDCDACGAARSAAAGAQREVLRLSGVVHVVGGPDVLHGRVLAALLGPEERVLQHPARAARQAVGCAARNAHGQPRRCRRANSRRAGQRSSNLARGGRQGSGPFCQAHGHLSLLRSHGRRLLYGLRAALHLLRALPRLVQEALHVTRTAALMSRNFCELTQVLICMCRPLMKRVSRAP